MSGDSMRCSYQCYPISAFLLSLPYLSTPFSPLFLFARVGQPAVDFDYCCCRRCFCRAHDSISGRACN